MLDTFIRTLSPIGDVAAMLKGFDGNRALVRDGGPTQVWQRRGSEWVREKPGMACFSDLSDDYIAFQAMLFRCGASHAVDGVPVLRLSPEDAKAWLQAMRCHAYAIEDAIGCTVDVFADDQVYTCASGLVPLSQFKSLILDLGPNPSILNWLTEAMHQGADQIDISFALHSQPERITHE